jgi:hypothetical protein
MLIDMYNIFCFCHDLIPFPQGYGFLIDIYAQYVCNAFIHPPTSPTRHLREMFKIDTADYMLSICGNSGLRELSSPGKSGSVFYISHDDRFMIKTMRKAEVKVRSHRESSGNVMGVKTTSAFHLFNVSLIQITS